VSSALTRRQIIDRGERLLIEHRYAEGLMLLEAAVTRFPRDPDVRLLFGTFLVDTRAGDAPEQLAEAVRLDVDNPVRLARAAGLLFALGYVDAAASYVARAIEITPDGFVLEAEVINVSGLIAAGKGHDELAEEALRESIGLDRSNEFFVRDLARYLAERGRTPAALAVIDAAVSRVRDPTVLTEFRTGLEA
jgi:Flp pilus assembly protein TadD